MQSRCILRKIGGGPDMRPLTLENAYLPTRYTLELKLDYARPNFSGRLAVDVAGNEPATDFRMVLHAHHLVIMSAQVLCATHAAKKLDIAYDRVAQTVTLSLAERLPSTARVVINYIGQINTIKTYKNPTLGLFKTNYLDSIEGKSDNFVLATHMQPQGARLVFPVIDELAIKVPIKLTIETRSDLLVASTAMLESKTDSENGFSKYVFRETPPMAVSVFGFVAGHFDRIEAVACGIPVGVYALRGDSDHALAAVSTTEKLLPVLEGLFGCKFPLEKLDFVALPFLSDGAMENWGLVTVISSQILVPLPSKEQILNLQQLVAHELVHQWMGNLVSFADWRDLWFNEAFATWFGNYALFSAGLYPDWKLQMIADYEKMMDVDCFADAGCIPSIYEQSSAVNTGIGCSTGSLFDRNSYEKGIILLNMAANLVQQDTSEGSGGYDRFAGAVANVIEMHKFKSIKVFEFWNLVNEASAADVNAFYHLWVRLHAYPVLTVTRTDAVITVEQNRFVFSSDPQTLGMENTPYHVPLLVRVLDDKGGLKTLNLVLLDRKTEIALPPGRLVLFNAAALGYFRTSYLSEIGNEVCSNFACMSREDQLSLIYDAGKLLGQENYTENALKFLVKFLSMFSTEEWTVDWDVLTLAMNYLETLNAILLQFSPYQEFGTWLQRYTARLWTKLGHWDALCTLGRSYSASEMQARNSIMLLSKSSDARSLCSKLYRALMNPKSGFFVPRELLPAIFNLTMAGASQKEYKQILSMAKNANLSVLNHTNGSAAELQTVAVSSLSFCESTELLVKTLNFAMNNIDSKLIELSVLGFQFKTEMDHKVRIFEWYKLHYNQWAKRSLRKGSDWAKQLQHTLKNLDMMILGDIMQFEPELIRLRDAFVAEKLASLPDHGLRDAMADIDAQNAEKRVVGSHYANLHDVLKSV